MPNETQTQTRDQVVSWLRQNNYSLSSYDRLIASVPGIATYTQLNELVAAFPQTFASAKIKGGLPGLKLIGPLPQEEPAFNSSDLSPVYDGNNLVGHTEPVAVEVPVVIPVEPVVPKTSSQNVEALIAKAAGEFNSSAAENYAHAALLSAQALFTLKNAEKQFPANVGGDTSQQA